MAKIEEHKESEASAEPDMRGKLLARLAVAGVLVAVLLGILAFFDHLSSVPEEEEAVVFTKPVPVAPKKPVSQPVTPAELPEPPVPAPVDATPPPPPPPPAPPAPVAEAVPPAPVARHESKADGKPETKGESRPASRSEGSVSAPPVVASSRSRPAESAPMPSVTTRPTKAVPEWTAPPAAIVDSDAAPKSTTPAKPTARVIESHGAPPAPTGVARLFSGFLLQAGVFSSAQRAEELHAKLTLSGVQSTLETRVQVGPFRTRQEAELAQAKLRELGVETVLVPPRPAR